MSEKHPEVAKLERSNAELTEKFNQAWSDQDCDRLLTYLSDDVVYMVYEGGPVHKGPKRVAEAVRPFMAKFERVEFKILRLDVIGSLVIHERTEDYYAPGGEVDTHFHVVGLLKIEDGKIVGWRDYGMPGATQIVGPLVTQK